MILAFIGLITCSIAWGPCLAPWQTKCFTGGAWGDYKFHYQGWVAYLNSSSFIPPYIQNFSWPANSSAMFMDSIPLVAIIFKPFILLFHLPAWQYFSFLSVVNAFLISWCSARIGQELQWKPVSTFCLGIVLLTSSLSWTRLLVHHEALQLHGILILAMTWIIIRQTSLVRWLALLVISVGIHAYFVPMVVCAMMPSVVSGKQRPKSLLLICLSTLLAIVLFGFLPGSASSRSDVWGANLLALIDPQTHSSIFSALVKKEPYEIEGYSYLGAGVILSLILVVSRGPVHSQQQNLFPRSWWLLSLFLFIFALGHTWNIADTPIIPHKAMLIIPGAAQLFDVFRSSGRYAWPLAYTLTVWLFSRIDKYKDASLLALIAVILQLLDSNLKTVYRLGTHFSNIMTSPNPTLEWARKNSVLASSISNAAMLVVGQVKDEKSLPPLYTPLYLNPTIVSNWGSVSARTPNAAAHAASAFDHWIDLVRSRDKTLLLPNCHLSDKCHTVLITDHKDQIKKLNQLSMQGLLQIQSIAPSAFKVHIRYE